MRRDSKSLIVLIVLLTMVIAACKGKAKPPVARPQPPVQTADNPPPAPPAPPKPIIEQPISVPPMPTDELSGKSIDDLNRDSPLQPLFFALDQSDVGPEGQQILQANAAVMKKYPTMQVTIEGHCDERGTAEYNLALGERRALAAKNYLVSLGIPADRLKTVSYGKEFPFEPGHDDAAWSKNRRAHFVITAK